MNNFELDPFACAEMLARPRSHAPVPTELDAGPWVRCTSCTDPGFDHDEFKWPEEGEEKPVIGAAALL